MIKLNYFVCFVAFQDWFWTGQTGFLPSSLWGSAAPLPSHTSDKQITRSSFCLQSESKTQKGRKGRKRWKCFYQALVQAFQAPLLHSSFSPSHPPTPPPLSAKASSKEGKGGRIKRKIKASQRWEVPPQHRAPGWPSAKQN